MGRIVAAPFLLALILMFATMLGLIYDWLSVSHAVVLTKIAVGLALCGSAMLLLYVVVRIVT